MSRLLEKLVFNQLYHYLDHHCLLSPDQSDFGRLHSTVTCSLKNTDDWYTDWTQARLLGMGFVDLNEVKTVLSPSFCFNIFYYSIYFYAFHTCLVITCSH